MGVEAGGVRHRDPGPEDRALEGPGEVAVAGEPQAAALGVADPQLLDRRCLLLGLLIALGRPAGDTGAFVSDGGVHSLQEHLHGLIDAAVAALIAAAWLSAQRRR